MNFSEKYINLVIPENCVNTCTLRILSRNYNLTRHFGIKPMGNLTIASIHFINPFEVSKMLSILITNANVIAAAIQSVPQYSPLEQRG